MNNKTKILNVYAAPIPTAKLLTNMLQSLVCLTGGYLRNRCSIDVKQNDIVWADVILLVRGADPYMEKISKSAHEAGRYCIMYLDDDLLNVPSNGIDTYKNALRNSLYWCDLLWSSNPNILKKYSNFMYSPKSIEEKVFEHIDTLLPPYNSSEKVKILYAGSPSHINNLQHYIIPALNSVYEHFNHIEVTFIGIQNGQLKNTDFPVVYIPWFKNIEKYKEYISKNRYHIGLAVVEDTEFYRCKFYNKFLEYGKIGILGIYSDCEPYRFIVKDHENGLLSKNSVTEWEKNIKEAVASSSLRNECIKNAQKTILAEFNTEKVLKQLLVKVPELGSYKANSSILVKYPTEKKHLRIYHYLVSTSIGYGTVQATVKIWHFLKRTKS